MNQEERKLPDKTSSPNDAQLAYAPASKASLGKWFFRLVRWSTYAAALITLIPVFHKASPPPVQASAQAAARAEEKFAEVERALSSGQAATLRLDESELNSYLASHLELKGTTPTAAAPAPPSSSSNPSPPTADEVQQMKSNVRDVKVQLISDRVHAYVVFDVYGKDMTLQLEGRLSAQNGFLRFEPTAGEIGAFPISQSTLEKAVQRLMDSPENREKLRLPENVSDLHIENGEVVISYK